MTQAQPKKPPFWKGFTLRFPRWPAKKRVQKRAPTGYEVAMEDTHLDFWNEKVPIILMMASQALVVSRWYIGADVSVAVWVGHALQWLAVVIGFIAGMALDLAMVTTVISRRNGRRGPWGAFTAAAATLFSALIALEMAGAWEPSPYLHAAYAVVIFLFVMHLSSPRLRALNLPLLVQRRQLIRRLVQTLRRTSQQFADASRDLADLRARFADVSQQLADLRARFAHREHDAAHEQQRVADREQEIAHLRNQLAQEQQRVAERNRQLADRDHQLAVSSREVGQLRSQLADRERQIVDLSQPLPDTSQLDLLAIAEQLKEGGVSWARIAGMLNLPESTLRSRLKARSNGHLNGVAT